MTANDLAADDLGVQLPSLRDIEIRHLAALQAVAQERSFGRAAEVLGFTQSAVSQQIAALERLTGETMFDRPGGPKPVEITPAGELMLRHAEAVLDRLREAERDLIGYKTGMLGRVSIGTYQSVSVKLLPQMIHRLREHRPGLEVRLLESDDQDELLQHLERRDLDLTFVVGPVTTPGVETITLCEDPFVVLSPIEEDLSDGEVVPTRLLNAVPLIGQQVNACQVLIEAGLRRAGVNPNIVFRTGDNAAVQAMVRSGMGHAVMPRLAVDLDDPRISIRRLDPDIPARTIAIAFDPARIPSAAEAFIEVAVEVCRELAPSIAGASATT